MQNTVWCCEAREVVPWPEEQKPVWSMPGDEAAPAQLPIDKQGGYYVIHKDRLLLIAGYSEGWTEWTNTQVLAYDFEADTWEELAPLSRGIQAFYPTAAASIGDWVYVHDDYDDVFLRYNPDTGVTEELTHCPGGIYDQPIVAFGGYIFRGLTDGGSVNRDAPIQFYDPSTDTWADAAISASQSTPRPYGSGVWWSWPSVLVTDEFVYVGTDDQVFRYYPDPLGEGENGGGWWEPMGDHDATGERDKDRFASPMMLLNGVLHSFGGDLDTLPWSTFAVMSEGEEQWRTRDLPDGHPDVLYAGGVSYGNKAYFWGGRNSAHIGQSGVWSYTVPEQDPERDIYLYGIDGDGFYIQRMNQNGGMVWYHKAWGETDLDDALNSWPGYGGGSGTSRGYFINQLYDTQGSSGAGFYLVSPDGESLGHVLEIVGQREWGHEVIEDSAGDHYALYFEEGWYAEDDTVLARWDGIDTLLWEATRDKIVALEPELSWQAGGAVALSPDEAVAVIAFAEAYVVGIDTQTGEVLWTFKATDKVSWLMPEAVRAGFNSRGDLLFIGDIDRSDLGGFSYQPGLWCLSFPGGYRQTPVLSWEFGFGEPEDGSIRAEPESMVVMPDGSAVVAWSWRDPEDSNYYRPYLTRVSASGSLVWEQALAEQMAANTEFEPYYSPMATDGRWLYLGMSGDLTEGRSADSNMRRVRIEDGVVEEDGTYFPLMRWPIGMWAVSAPLWPEVIIHSPAACPPEPPTTGNWCCVPDPVEPGAISYPWGAQEDEDDSPPIGVE